MSGRSTLWRGLCVWLLCSVTAHAEVTVLIVSGLPGEARYASEFATTSKAVAAASASITGAEHVQTLSGDAATLNNLAALFKQLASRLTATDRLLVYLIGHGSHDGYEYKFNLPGPDLSASQLQRWLDAVPAAQLIVATGSSSGALQEKLQHEQRIVLTATRNGNERNATHFGRLLTEAFAEHAADTDKDGRITAQEVFEFTSRKVKDYFDAEARMITEHAQLSGSNAERFTVWQAPISTVTTAATAPLLAERMRVNEQLEALRLRRNDFSEDDYLAQLEPLLLRLAELDAQLASATASKEATP